MTDNPVRQKGETEAEFAARIGRATQPGQPGQSGQRAKSDLARQQGESDERFELRTGQPHWASNPTPPQTPAGTPVTAPAGEHTEAEFQARTGGGHGQPTWTATPTQPANPAGDPIPKRAGETDTDYLARTGRPYGAAQRADTGPVFEVPWGAMQGPHETDDQYRNRVYNPRMVAESDAQYRARFIAGVTAASMPVRKDGEDDRAYFARAHALHPSFAKGSERPEDPYASLPGRAPGESDAVYQARLAATPGHATPGHEGWQHGVGRTAEPNMGKEPSESEPAYQARMLSLYPRLERETEEQWRTRVGYSPTKSPAPR